VLSVEDWAEIRRLHFAEKMGIRTISKQLSISRNTVRSAVRTATPPAYRRRRRPSAVDPYEPQIRVLLKDCPTMPATVIAERIGWTRGMTILKERIAEIRPLFLEPDPFQRTDYRPGELAQWDVWLPDVDIPVVFGHAARLPAIVGVPGYSRVIVGRMIPSRAAPDLLLGHRACLVELGAVPRKGVYDNEAAIGRKRRDGTVFTQEFLAFKGALGMGAVILEKGHPERNGRSRARHRLSRDEVPAGTDLFLCR
jgi:transposase